MSATRQLADALVISEENRQDEKWGIDRDLDDYVWLAIITEELGETAEAMLKELPTAQDELVQVVAVGMQWLDNMLRRKEQEHGRD